MATITWDTGVSGDFAAPDNWSTDTVPGSSDVADIDAAGTYTVTSSANEKVERLLVSGDAAMNIAVRYPDAQEAFLKRCHAAGQTKPTPLLLRYGVGDYNCLHQDIYGEHVFPLQMVFLLSRPGADFEGGELVLTEQRPRMQSRTEVVPLRQGEGAIFPVHHRPVQGTRGTYRVNMRHGVSRLRGGRRHTLGVIFHDAR